MKKVKARLIENLFSEIVLLAYSICFILFVVFLLNQIAVGAYICGLLILLCLFLLIVQPLTSKKRITTFDWISILFSFISFAVIASVYIASITNDNLRTSVLTITASSISGLLTLFGVGLTVKSARLDKKEDELKSIKPSIFPISETTWSGIPKEKQNIVPFSIFEEYSELKKAKNNKDSYYLRSMLIANSDMSLSVLYGISINDKIIKSKYESVLLKNGFYMFIIDYKFVLKEPIKNVSLLLEDVLQNTYVANMNYEIDMSRKNGPKEILIKSVISIDLLSLAGK